MKSARIVHFCPAEKFIPPFISFVARHFDATEHLFVIWGGDAARHPVASSDRVIVMGSLAQLSEVIRLIRQAEKVMLHGLFNNRLNVLLSALTCYLPKCYWFIWGWDLYVRQRALIWGEAPDLRWKINEVFRRRVIGRIGHLVSAVKGDYELAREWYGARGEWIYCLMYLSNLCLEGPSGQRTDGPLRILVGNSGDPSNEHLEIFAQLAALGKQDFIVYVPLSYGRSDYIARILDAGRITFGPSFRPLMDFVPRDVYSKFMSDIDIAIFNHRRQQAMGNIINFLGMGKRVFLRRSVTTFDFLERLGLRLFDAASLCLEPLDSSVATRNAQIIREHFSEEQLKQQLAALFGRGSRGT